MMRPHDESMLELASLRAIDALEADEAAIIDAHMAQCAQCQVEYRRSALAGAALAQSAASPAPAALRQRVLASAVKIRRIRPWYQRPPLAAAAIAAAVVVASGSWIVTHPAAQSQQRWAAACVPSTSACGGDVVLSVGILRLEAHGMPALPPGKVYQAWVIHPKQAPVPEPTFGVSTDGDGSVEIPATATNGDVVAVTVEPKGGSHAPTTKPLLVATIE
jgi:anti-sigma-K factor RskA